MTLALIMPVRTALRWFLNDDFTLAIGPWTGLAPTLTVWLLGACRVSRLMPLFPAGTEQVRALRGDKGMAGEAQFRATVRRTDLLPGTAVAKLQYQAASNAWVDLGVDQPVTADYVEIAGQGTIPADAKDQAVVFTVTSPASLGLYTFDIGYWRQGAID